MEQFAENFPGHRNEAAQGQSCCGSNCNFILLTAEAFRLIISQKCGYKLMMQADCFYAIIEKVY